MLESESTAVENEYEQTVGESEVMNQMVWIILLWIHCRKLFCVEVDVMKSIEWTLLKTIAFLLFLTEGIKL